MRFLPNLVFCILTSFAMAGLLHAQAPAPPQASPQPVIELGEIANGVYRNSSFGFSYRLPFGWVDRTDEMRDASTDPGKSLVLLATFERPPAATGSTVNSAVVIAAESVSSYPGLKSAAQYFGPLSELTKEKGLTVVNEPYEFPVDAKPIVRRDFMKRMGGVTMHQSTMAMLAKGYVLSFTIIGGSDDEVTSLIEGLKFGPVGKSGKGAAKTPGR
jgi:hypothetical protein